MLYILLFGSRARGESHPDSGWDLFCHHLSRSVARREERDHQKMSIPFAQIGFHADVILQSQEKVKTPNEKTGVPCLSCAQRGSGLTNEDAVALWIRKAQTGLKIANLSRARGPSHPGYPISHHPLRRYGHSVSAPHRVGAPLPSGPMPLRAAVISAPP